MSEPKTFEQAVTAVMFELRDLMVERHRKYGPGNIEAFGLLGCLVRASDKIERLKRSLDADFPDDAAEDAWKDMANYGVIALMYKRGWWGLPLEES